MITLIIKSIKIYETVSLSDIETSFVDASYFSPRPMSSPIKIGLECLEWRQNSLPTLDMFSLDSDFITVYLYKRPILIGMSILKNWSK